MVERIIRANKKLALSTSAESHVFEEGEVYNMRFGHEIEFDNLLEFGNFLVSNAEELNKFLSGTLDPLKSTKKSKDVTKETGDDTTPLGTIVDVVKAMNGEMVVPDVPQGTPPAAKGLLTEDPKEIDVVKVVQMIKDGKDIEDLIIGLTGDQKKEIMSLVEGSEMSDDGKEKIITLLKKRSMSKCPICEKRKKKEEPFCTTCLELKENTPSLGVDIVQT